MSSMQKGEHNSQYGKYWICNLESQENRKIFKDEPVPNGWIKGRNLWKKSSFCVDCNKPVTLTSRKFRRCKDCTVVKKREVIEKNRNSEKIRKTTDDELKLALLENDLNIRQAFLSLGLSQGSNYARARRIIMGLSVEETQLPLKQLSLVRTQ